MPFLGAESALRRVRGDQVAVFRLAAIAPVRLCACSRESASALWNVQMGHDSGEGFKRKGAEKVPKKYTLGTEGRCKSLM